MAILNTFIQIAAAVGPSLFIGVLSSVAGSVEAAGTAAALAQAEGFSVAVAVACVIAGIGMLTALAYARKRQRLAEEAPDASTTGAASPAARPKTVEHGPEALTARALMKAPCVVAESASVREVMAQLIDRKTSGLPVVDGRGAIVGFVTDGDVLASLGKPDAAGFDLTASLAVVRDMRNFDERFAETLSANVMDIAHLHRLGGRKRPHRRGLRAAQHQAHQESARARRPPRRRHHQPRRHRPHPHGPSHGGFLLDAPISPRDSSHPNAFPTIPEIRGRRTTQFLHEIAVYERLGVFSFSPKKIVVLLQLADQAFSKEGLLPRAPLRNSDAHNRRSRAETAPFVDRKRGSKRERAKATLINRRKTKKATLTLGGLPSVCMFPSLGRVSRR